MTAGGGVYASSGGRKALWIAAAEGVVSGRVERMGTHGQRWSTLDLEEARRLYDSGLSFREVGERLGFAPSYIAARFRRDGVPCRPSGRPLPTPAPEVDSAEIVDRKQRGESFVAIAAALGMSRDMVRDRYLIAVGRPRRATERRRRSFTWHEV